MEEKGPKGAEDLPRVVPLLPGLWERAELGWKSSLHHPRLDAFSYFSKCTVWTNRRPRTAEVSSKSPFGTPQMLS